MKITLIIIDFKIKIPPRKSLFNTFIGVNGIYGLKLLRKTEVHLESIIKTAGIELLEKQLNEHMMADIGRGVLNSRKKQNSDMFSSYYCFIPKLTSMLRNGGLLTSQNCQIK